MKDEIPFEFVQQVAEILGYPIDERGNYRPPVGTVNLNFITPAHVAEQVLQNFDKLRAIQLAARRHAANRKVEGEAKRLARLEWSADSRLGIGTVARRIHAKLQQDGHRAALSTCTTHARAVHNDELNLPQRHGPRRKNKYQPPAD